MKDLIVVAIIVCIVGGALMYIIKAKQSGAKCVGCSLGGQCPSRKNVTSCNCHNH